jgi:hypothetical protein
VVVRRLQLYLALAALQLSAAPELRAEANSCGLICFLDAHNHPLELRTASLRVSNYITNGSTLTPDDEFARGSLAESDFRIQVDDAGATEGAFAEIESRTPAGTLRANLRVPLKRAAAGQPLRSAFLRLVADELDNQARGAQTRTLRVALRDFVTAKYSSSSQGPQQIALRVGKAGDSGDVEAASAARVMIHVLRLAVAGSPVIGRDDRDALAQMRKQLSAANEIWLQCNLSFGDPSETWMEIVSPPPPTLLSISNEDGLPARGGGELRFRVGGRSVGPLVTRAGARPIETAQAIVHELRTRGFYAQASENLPTRSGAGGSADVLIRGADGSLVHIDKEPGQALSTDARQTLVIGSVDLGDGVQEFDNMTAQVGSLEERTLIKALADDDPRSIDLFVINQFTGATRQGEAFIADPAGAIANVVLIDRNGLKHAPLAWTLAHELGHVLMDDPLHPDNVGPDRPWLLMDADSGRGTVDGPKRLRPQDCQRLRNAAREARFPLLVPFDSAQPG